MMYKVNFRFYPAILAALAVLPSCSSKLAAEKEPAYERIPSTLSIKASCGTKTVLVDGDEIQWTADDRLVVFDSDNRGVEFVTDDNHVADAIFSTHEWTGREPRFAALSPSFTASCDSDGCLFLELSARQSAVPGTYCPSAMPAAGEITGAVGSYAVRMLAVGAMLKLPLPVDEQDSVVVSAPGGENLAGCIDVDFSGLEKGESSFWKSSAGDRMSRKVTLLPEDGGLIGAGTYYVCVLPQNYSNGIKVDIYGKSGRILASATMDACELSRNEIRELAFTVPDGLPDVVTLDLKFNNASGMCPFGTLLEAAVQTAAGDEYTFTYEYELDGTQMSRDFKFIIGGKTSKGYSYGPNAGLPYTPVSVLKLNDANMWIKVPAITGHYLAEVTYGMGNAYARWVKIQEKVGNTSVAQIQPKISDASGAHSSTIHFYTDGNDCPTASLTGNTTKPATPYFIVAANSILFDYITLKYTRELPERN